MALAPSTKRGAKKKRLNWQCKCDEKFVSQDALTIHYRREHRDDGYGLWDICGDLGDDFANSAMKVIHDRRVRESELLRQAEDKAKAYDQLRERFGALCRALQIGSSAMDAYRDAYEREKP